MYCAKPKPGRFFSTRCRKCKPCLQLRREDWSSRAVWEILSADKSVFITLTFRRKPTNGYDEFQRYAKRVRITLVRKFDKTTRLRFVCAAEFGESRGRYHLHGILSVYGGNPPVRFFRDRWKGGITHARAIAPDGAKRVGRYVAKYLAKAGRVNSSNGYGTSVGTQERIRNNVSRNNATAEAIFAAFPGAEVAAFKAQGEKPLLAPYALRRARKRVRYQHQPEFRRTRMDEKRAVHWLDAVWGDFAPLSAMGSVYYDPPELVTEGEYSDPEELAGTE